MLLENHAINLKLFAKSKHFMSSELTKQRNQKPKWQKQTQPTLCLGQSTEVTNYDLLFRNRALTSLTIGSQILSAKST